MMFLGLLFVLAMIAGGVLILRKLRQTQHGKAMSRAEDGAVNRLKQIRQKTDDKGNHISYAAMNDWTEDKLNGGFMNRNITRAWKYHLDCCPECREIFEFYRSEHEKKVMKKLEEGLKN